MRIDIIVYVTQNAIQRRRRPLSTQNPTESGDEWEGDRSRTLEVPTPRCTSVRTLEPVPTWPRGSDGLAL